MNLRIPISADIRAWVSYDPDEGTFTWLRSRGKVRAGTPCGSTKRHDGGWPYHNVRLNGRCYLGHRVAWFLMTGEQPPDTIDHIDGNGLNNRWRNLREATGTQNGANRRQQRDCAKGTYCLKGRWQAYIRVSGKKLHLGCYGTEAEAHAAYLEAARAHFGEFARAA